MTATATLSPGPQFGGLTLATPATSGPLVFHASTTGLNRYNFRLRSEGWRLANFRRNPVVFWLHDPTKPPIGRAEVDTHPAGGLRASVTFDRGDPFAADVDRKYREGFLHAVSVGWGFVTADGKPVMDWHRLSAEQIERELFYDLEEISAVPIPADAGAVRELARLGRGAVARELADLLAPDLTLHPAGVAALLAAISVPANGRETVDQAAARRLLEAFTF
jgi:hypothetical protein